MLELHDTLIALLFFIVALLYASVGHAGASGYIAAMAIIGTDPAIMKPTALALNILVAIIATFKFYRAGAFSLRLFIPLVITSIPCAYLGGLITLPGYFYKPVVGVILIYAAWRSFQQSSNSSQFPLQTIKVEYLLLTGALLGFLSGLSGVGGGIFLSPLLLFLRAAHPRTISGIAAAFILVNSIAGLLGAVSKGVSLSPMLPYWALAVVVGGYIGAELGSKKLANNTILKILGIVLLIAGIKLLATF